MLRHRQRPPTRTTNPPKERTKRRLTLHCKRKVHFEDDAEGEKIKLAAAKKSRRVKKAIEDEGGEIVLMLC